MCVCILEHKLSLPNPRQTTDHNQRANVLVWKITKKSLMKHIEFQISAYEDRIWGRQVRVDLEEGVVDFTYRGVDCYFLVIRDDGYH